MYGLMSLWAKKHGVSGEVSENFEVCKTEKGSTERRPKPPALVYLQHDDVGCGPTFPVEEG